MTKQEMLARIREIGVIPAVRVSSKEEALFASQAVYAGGIPIVEITMTTPGAPEVVSELLRNCEGMIVGAGTVLDVDTAKLCLDCRVSFLTSPGLDPDVLEFAHAHDIAMIPGALTPTEVMMARRAGADMVKVFPTASVGGPHYLRALKGPFPNMRLVASGGVTQHNATDFIRAGADAIGVGADLLPREAVRARNEEWIHELARRFVGMVRQGRADHNHQA